MLPKFFMSTRGTSHSSFSGSAKGVLTTAKGRHVLTAIDLVDGGAAVVIRITLGEALPLSTDVNSDVEAGGTFLPPLDDFVWNITVGASGKGALGRGIWLLSMRERGGLLDFFFGIIPPGAELYNGCCDCICCCCCCRRRDGLAVPMAVPVFLVPVADKGGGPTLDRVEDGLRDGAVGSVLAGGGYAGGGGDMEVGGECPEGGGG